MESTFAAAADSVRRPEPQGDRGLSEANDADRPCPLDLAAGALDVIECLPVGVLATDHTGMVVAANSAAKSVLGQDPLALGVPMFETVLPEDRDKVFAEVVAAVEQGRAFSFSYRTRVDGGDTRWIHTNGRCRLGDDGSFAGVVGVVQDVTSAVRAHEGRQRFTDMLDAATDLVVFLDPNGAMIWANRAATRFVDECRRARPWEGSSLEFVLAGASRERWESVAMPSVLSKGSWLGELDLGVDLRHAMPVTASVVGHYDATGQLEYLSVIARDISDLREAHRVLEAQATHDGLTGLPNRGLFMEHLGTAIKRVGRHAPSVAVMFCDLDGFKAVNDGLGHEAGDQLLVEVAKRLRNAVREGDVVGRFGGDEFCILLPGIDTVETAQMVAGRIMRRIEEPIALDGGEGHVGLSVGIAVTDDPTTDPEHLLAEADAAMYQAKAAGKRRQQLFDDGLRRAARIRSELVKAMPSAVEAGEFESRYVPVVSLADGALVGIEASLRWNHAVHGAIDPARWVSLAYEAGTILPLDRIAIADGCTRAAQWNALQSGGDALTVWVTVGAQDLLRGGLADHIAREIEESGAGPGAFGVEVGLEALARHPREAQDILQSLSWLGVRVALDDFGSGDFTLAQLQRFRAETIKLDRALVRSLAREPGAITAVSAIVQLAGALGLSVQAKGVSTTAELELLQELGVHSAQGDVVGCSGQAAEMAGLFGHRPAWAHGAWPNRERLPGGFLGRAQVIERMLVLREAALASGAAGEAAAA